MMFCFVRLTMHPPSQIFPRDTSDPKFRSGKMCPVFTFSDILGRLNFFVPANFIYPRLEGMLRFSFIFDFCFIPPVYGARWMFAPEIAIALLFVFRRILMILKGLKTNLYYLLYFGLYHQAWVIVCFRTWRRPWFFSPYYCRSLPRPFGLSPFVFNILTRVMCFHASISNSWVSFFS